MSEEENTDLRRRRSNGEHEDPDLDEMSRRYSDYKFIEQLLISEIDNAFSDNEHENGTSAEDAAERDERNAEDIVQRIFSSVPVNERYIWLDRMSDILKQRDYYYALRNRRRNPTFKIIWVLNNTLPLPTVNYPKLIAKIDIRRILEYIRNTIILAFEAIKICFFLAGILYQVFMVLRIVMQVTRMVTFSRSFFGQIASFIFEYDTEMIAMSNEMNRSLLNLHCQSKDWVNRTGLNSGSDVYLAPLIEKWLLGRQWFSVDNGNGEVLLVMYILKQWMFRIVSETLVLECSDEFNCSDLSSFTCSLNRKTLIFRFEDILLQFFPHVFSNGAGEGGWLLKMCTLLTWSTYVTSCITVMYLVFWNSSVRMAKIANRYVQCMVAFAKSIGNVF